jgi:hypothetical protein
MEVKKNKCRNDDNANIIDLDQAVKHNANSWANQDIE